MSDRSGPAGGDSADADHLGLPESRIPSTSITIRQLEYLIAVADHHSFTRAADALYVSQPTLSQQLMKLEDSLQTQLLDRTRRDVSLSEAGRLYAAYAVRALRELRDARRALSELDDLSRGELRLAMVPPVTKIVGLALARFTESYPGVEVTVVERDQETICRRLVDRDIDVGIGFTALSADEERLGVEARAIGRHNISYLVGRMNAAYQRTAPLTPTELTDERMVLLSRDYALRRYVDAYCRQHDVELKVITEVNSLAMLLEVVSAGALGTICFDVFATERWGLSAVPVSPALGSTEIVVLRRRERYESRACRAFCEILEATAAATRTSSEDG